MVLEGEGFSLAKFLDNCSIIGGTSYVNAASPDSSKSAGTPSGAGSSPPEGISSHGAGQYYPAPRNLEPGAR